MQTLIVGHKYAVVRTNFAELYANTFKFIYMVDYFGWTIK